MTVLSQRKVLLLNQMYMPLRSTTVRHAIELLQRGRAEPVDGVAAKLETVDETITVPSILRLKYYSGVPERNRVWSRRAVVQRDRCTCIYCGARKGQDGLTRSDFTVDHIIPRSRGGANTWGNTACACHACNHRKADRAPHEAGMKLLWEPKRPRVNYLIASGDVPDEWKIYLKI